MLQRGQGPGAWTRDREHGPGTRGQGGRGQGAGRGEMLERREPPSAEGKGASQMKRKHLGDAEGARRRQRRGTRRSAAQRGSSHYPPLERDSGILVNEIIRHLFVEAWLPHLAGNAPVNVPEVFHTSSSETVVQMCREF